MSNNEAGTFELALRTAASLPMVKIERDKFLKKELSKYYCNEQVSKAIEFCPAYARIDLSMINKIAESCIKYETNKVSAISFAAGIPGGIAMIGTVPADTTQYFGHMLRILQKLIYLYGWDEIFDENGNMDDETTSLLTLFVGIMFGVNGAAATITKISNSAANKVSKSLASKALTKGTLYPLVKKVAQSLGMKMTKDTFAKGVSKAIPIVGGVTSGGLTYLTFRPMARKLKRHLATLKCANPENYQDDIM